MVLFSGRVHVAIAFSSEVDTGSRQENASNKEVEPPFRFNRTEKALEGVPMALSVESDVARDSRAEPIDVISTEAVLGAEVRGVDLKELNELQFAALKRAWHDHQVILVRGQTLHDQDLIAFSRSFGDLDWAPVQETGRRFVEGLPEIYIVSNVKVNGEPIGSLGDGEAVWHTDMSYLDMPPKASMLYSLEIPT